MNTQKKQPVHLLPRLSCRALKGAEDFGGVGAFNPRLK
jgi:hypothetical protein